MTNAAKMSDDPAREKRYRHGYTHGVEAMLAAVQDLLTEEQKTRLNAYRNQLLDWRVGHGEFQAPNPPALD